MTTTLSRITIQHISILYEVQHESETDDLEENEQLSYQAPVKLWINNSQFSNSNDI